MQQASLIIIIMVFISCNQCTTPDSVHAIFKKCQIDPTHVVQAFCIHISDLNIVIDDVIHELSEEQDVIIEFSELFNSDLLEFNLDKDSLSSLASCIAMKLIF